MCRQAINDAFHAPPSIVVIGWCSFVRVNQKTEDPSPLTRYDTGARSSESGHGLSAWVERMKKRWYCHHNRGSCIVSHYSLHDTSADEKNWKNIVQECMARRRNHMDMDRINEKISTSTPVSAIKTIISKSVFASFLLIPRTPRCQCWRAFAKNLQK